MRSGILTGMLTDASAAREPIRRVVVESLARPSRRSMALAVRSFILNRVDVSAELALLTVPSLFVASDDRGDWSPQDAQAAAALAPDAEAVTVDAARTLIPLEQPEKLALLVRRFWDQQALTDASVSSAGCPGYSLVILRKGVVMRTVLPLKSTVAPPASTPMTRPRP